MPSDFIIMVLKHQKDDLRSPHFAIDRLFMKLFKTNNSDTVGQCQQFKKNFDLPIACHIVVNTAAKFRKL